MTMNFEKSKIILESIKLKRYTQGQEIVTCSLVRLKLTNFGLILLLG